MVCQFKSSPGLARPGIQAIFVLMAPDPISPDLKLAQHSGVLFEGYQMRPATTSAVHLGGPQPGDPPVITARFLEDNGR